jgi:hypothetical protein
MKKILVGLLVISSTSAFTGTLECNDLKVHFTDFKKPGVTCDTIKCLEQVLPQIGTSKIENVSCALSQSRNWQIPTVSFSDIKTRSSRDVITGEYICIEDGVHFLDNESCSTVKCVESFKEKLKNSSLGVTGIKALDSKCKESASGNWKFPVVQYSIQIKN